MLRMCKHSIVKTRPSIILLSNFGTDKKSARRRYKKFVEEGVNVRVENPLRNVFGWVLLGGRRVYRKNPGFN